MRVIYPFISSCTFYLQAVLDFTYHDETVLTDQEFPEKDSRERIADIFGQYERHTFLITIFSYKMGIFPSKTITKIQIRLLRHI